MSESNTRISRRRPLSTCASSTIAVAQGLYKKTKDLNGPIGSMTKRLAKATSMASPLANVVRYHCLAALAIADDHILSFERRVESHIPPSRHVFNMIDNVVVKVEALPKRFKNGMSIFPTILHKIPFLEWGVIYAVKWLEFITSILVIWILDGAKEKEIRVDTNCKRQHNNSSLSKISSPMREGDHNRHYLRCSYEEALINKGMSNAILEESYSQGYEKDHHSWIDEPNGEMILTSEDSLLELFEFGWQAPKASTSSSRSNSYILKHDD